MIIGPQNVSDELPVSFGVDIYPLRLVSTSVQIEGDVDG